MIPAVALGALLLGGPAEPAATRAAGPGAVSLAVDGCPAVPREELARLLALELAAPVLAPDQAGERAVHVQVACAGTTVRLAVDDPGEGIQLRREAVFPPAQGDVVVRLVALAITELVLTSRVALSLEKGPDAPAERVAPPPAAPAREGARPPGRAYLLAFGQAVGPFSGVGVGWGGGLRLGWAFGRGWRERSGTDPGLGPRLGPVLDVELAAAESSADRTLGTVQVSLWSTTLRALVRLRAGRAWLDLGGGARLGLAQLRGVPADATVARGSGLAGTWAGPLAYAGVGSRFGHVVVALGLEAGHVLRPVSGTVDQGPPIAVDGNWACATVAAGWGE
jgi:hypothetical protein